MRIFWKTDLIILLAGALLVFAECGRSGALFAQTKDISKAGSVSGQLLDATNLTPIKDGKVFLTTVTHVIKSVSSDEQGVYHFAGLDPGIYSISASAEGHRDESMPNYLVVRPGSDLRDVDLRLPRPGVISGRVHDASGLPLSYVALELLNQKGDHEVPCSGSMEKNGDFRISVQPGRYYLRAVPNSARTDADSMPTDTHPFYFPQAHRIEDAGTIEVVSGKEISGIDLTLKSAPTYSISGKVIDGVSGKPVSYGVLHANHYVHHTEIGQSSEIAADGSFRLEGMPAGHYHMQLAGEPPYRSATIFPATEFDLGDQDMSGVVLIFKPGVVLHGHVTATRPLPPEVSLILTNHDGKDRTSRHVYPQADGSFEFPHLYPGTYDLIVDGNTWHIRQMRLGDKTVDTKTEGIVVKDAAPLPEVNITLDSEVGTVSGTVMDGRGALQPGVSVVLMSQDPKPSPVYQVPRFRSGITGLDGRYHIEKVIPGDYWLLAWPRTTEWDLFANPDLFAKVETEAVTIQVPASSVVRDLKLTSTIRAAAADNRSALDRQRGCYYH